MENQELYDRLKIREVEDGLSIDGFISDDDPGCEVLDIPDSWGVTDISGFFGCNSIKKVRLPSTLKRLHNAFSRCMNLEEVVFPTEMTELGDGNFQDCEKLLHVELPKGLTRIGFSNFSVYGIYIGSHGSGVYNDPANWQDKCFYLGTYLLKSFQNSGTLTVRDGTTLIASCACSSTYISEVVFPSSLKYVCSQAFYSCKALSAPILPDGIEFIGEEAFNNGYIDILRGIHVTDGTIGNDGRVEIKKTLGFFTESERRAAKELFAGKLLRLEYTSSWSYDNSDDDRASDSSSGSSSVRYGRIDPEADSTALLRVDGEIRGVVFRVDPNARYGPDMYAFLFDGSNPGRMMLGYSASHSSHHMTVTRVSLVEAGKDGAPETAEHVNFTPSSTQTYI